ncbi:MAG: hypothetical protein ACRCTZ_16365 [Sarcina sp.]
MKNSILLIENNVLNLKKNSLFFEGLIYTKSNARLEDIILFRDSMFSLTLTQNYTLKAKKLYSTLNIYYSEFIDFSITIKNDLGMKKLILHINSYLLDYLIDSLKTITLEENDIISINSTLYELSKFENTIYNRKPFTKTTVFKVSKGALLKVKNGFINSKAIFNENSIEVSGFYLKNTLLNISYNSTIFSLATDNFGYFNKILPLLPLGLKLTLSSAEAIPLDIEVIHSLSKDSLKNSIKIYSIFNTPCKLSNLTFDLYKRKFKVTSYSSGVLANTNQKSIFSFTLFNDFGEIILNKEFNGNTTDIDLINALNNIELKNSFYVLLESSCEIFKFGSQSKLVSNILLHITDKEIIKIFTPKISLDFNILKVKSIYKDSTLVVKINDTITNYHIESNNFSISLPKDIKFESKITVYIEGESFKTIPVTFYSSYKSKNTAFLFNTNLSALLSHNYNLKDVYIDNKFFITSKYALPLYFFESGRGRISITTDFDEDYALYLLNDTGIQEIDTFKTNCQNKFTIPSNGIIFIDLAKLYKATDKIKLLFKPIDICYRNLVVLNTRDHIKESDIIFKDYLNFKNIINTKLDTTDSLIISKFFSIYILNKNILTDIDSTFSLFSDIFYNISNNRRTFKDFSTHLMEEN